MFGSNSQDNNSTDTSAIPTGNALPKDSETKTEVVNYVIRPSGKEEVEGKLVYSNKPEGPSILSLIPGMIAGIVLFPFKLIFKIVDILFRTLGLIQMTFMTVIIMIVVILLAVVLTILYKPVFIWNPLKTYLNNEINVGQITPMGIDEVYSKINEDGLESGEVKLDNSEFTAIIRDYTLLDERIRVLSVNNGMIFNINIDVVERPLWFIIETEKLNNKMHVKRVGFGRFNTPQEITGLLNDTVGVVFNIIEQQVTAENYLTFFEQIINESKLDDRLSLQSVEMQADSLYLQFDVLEE